MAIFDLRNIDDLHIGGVRADVLLLGGTAIWTRPSVPGEDVAFPAEIFTAFGAAWDPYDDRQRLEPDGSSTPPILNHDSSAFIPPIGGRFTDFAGSSRALILKAQAGWRAPVLRELDGRRCWEFDGENDYLETVWTERLEPPKTITFFAMVYGQPDLAGYGLSVTRGENSNSMVVPIRTGTGTFATAVRQGGAEFGTRPYGSLATPGWHTVFVEYSITAWAANGGRLRVELDGVEVQNVALTPVKSVTANISAMTRLVVGAKRSASVYSDYFRGRIGRHGVISRALTGGERGLLRRWLQATQVSEAGTGIAWPAAVSPDAWTVTEVTDPAEATSNGFTGEHGHLRANWGAITIPEGFELRHTLTGGVVDGFDADFENVVPSSTFYTEAPLALGATVYPRIFWHHVATGQAMLAGTKPAITVKGLTSAAPAGLPAIGSTTLNRIRAYPLFRHNADAMDQNPAMGWTVGSLADLGYSVVRGDTASDSRFLAQIRNLLTPTGSPAAQGGFGLQFEIGPMAAFVLAKLTPRIWGALTADEKARMTALVKAIGAAGAQVASDDYQWPTTQGYNIVANQAWRNGNPNFSAAPRAAVSFLALWFGSTSAVNSYLHGFVKADLQAELNRLGLAKPAAVWARRTATPTDAQIEAAIRGGGSFTADGYALSDLQGLWVRNMERCFSARVMSGLGGNSGNNWIGPGTVINGQARGKVMGSPTPPSYWTAIRGQLGMIQEMNSTDAKGLRSAVSYSMLTLWIAHVWTMVMIATNRLDRENADVQAAFDRFRNAVLDLRWKDAVGYYSTSHAGSAAGTNEDWTHAAYSNQRGLDTLDEVWTDVIEPWRTA